MNQRVVVRVGTDSVDRSELLAQALSGQVQTRNLSRSTRLRSTSPHVAEKDNSAVTKITLESDACQSINQAESSSDATAFALAAKLRALANQSDQTEASLLETLALFDKQEGWRVTGAKDCARWMCSELGMSRALAYEKLRVARALQDLPVIASHFRDARLSWSKVRFLTRVATPEDEAALVTMALDCDANVVATRCDEYRWGKHGELAAEDEAEADRQRHGRRSLTKKPLPDGSIEFRVILPPDMAANLTRCLDYQEERLFEHDNSGNQPAFNTAVGTAVGTSDGTSDCTSDCTTDSNTTRLQDSRATKTDSTPNLKRKSTPRLTAAQRRADALVAMGEAALSGNSDGLSSADRFLVVAHIDADALYESVASVAATAHESEEEIDAPLPTPVRAALAGIAGGGISPATARRLACDGSLITMIMKNGEPIAVGRKTRSWNPATRRAVLARDGCCAFPGCGATRNLDVHHVHDWALGGKTSVDGGVSLCRSCHTRVHDEGWQIRRLPDSARSSRSTAADSVHARADVSTRKTTAKLDARRPIFRFSLPDK